MKTQKTQPKAKVTLKRRLIQGLVWFVFLVAVLFVIAPVWSPWVLRPVLGRFGVEYASHERIGWSRLKLNEVTYQNARTGFTAERIECLQPLVWLWHGWIGFRGGVDEGAEPLIDVDDWSLTVELSDSDSDKKRSVTSVRQLWGKLEGGLQTLNRWLPEARLEAGMIRIKDESVFCPTFSLKQGMAKAVFVSERLSLTNYATVDLSDPESASVRLELQPEDVVAALTIEESQPMISVSGDVYWQENHVTVEAEFGENGYLPDRASINGESIQVRSELIRLKDYEDVLASISGQWDGREARFEVTAQARPMERAARLPPLEVDLRFSATTNLVELNEAVVRVPGVNGELTDPVRMNYSGEVLSDEAVVDLELDLSQQPWLNLTGTMTGRAVVVSLETNRSNVAFDFGGTNVVGFGINAERLELTGEFADMRLQLQDASVLLADGSEAELSGGIDFTAKTIRDAEVSFRGPYLNRYLGTNWHYEDIELSAVVSGDWAQPEHSGGVRFTNLTSARLQPVSGELTWAGTNTVLESFRTLLRSEPGELELAGAINWQTNRGTLVISNGMLRPEVGSECELISPAMVSVERIKSDPGSGETSWSVAVTNFVWSGGQGRLELGGEVNWPDSGQVKLLLEGTSSELLAPLLPNTWATSEMRWLVERVEARAEWREGPISFSNRLSGSVTVGNLPEIDIQLEAEGNRDGVRIAELTATDASGEFFSAAGAIPVALLVSSKGFSAELMRDARLDLTANLQGGDALWQMVADEIEVLPLKPDVQLNLEGTLADPSGRLTARANSVQITRGFGEGSTNSWPALTNIQIECLLSGDVLRAEEVSMRIEGQPTYASLELPISSDFWLEPLKGDWVPDWRDATGAVSVSNASLAAFSSYLPAIFLPQGRLRADLKVEKGGRVNGEVQVAGVETRPLEPLGAVRDVKMNLVFQGWDAEIKSLSGMLGGQTANVTGKVNWKDWTDPIWEIELKGSGIPLVRKPGLIIRSDLDLRAAKSQGETTLISGDVTFRDSYYLSDLRSLIPGRVSTARRRPPYFSVTEQPYADYRLDVRLQGDQGIRVRTPLFHGLVSADLRLGGTMEQPFTIGELEIHSGQVVFPFARMRIDQGQVFMTSENPYRPQLFIVGTSRTLGYEVNAQITGPVDDPVWEMSSSPPLSTEAIVLMLTAGEVPREDFSYSQSQRAGKLAMFVGRNLLSDLSTSENVEERLVIRSGESVTHEGQETYSVEYKLTDTLSVVGEYDRFGEVNAGLKWRVYSK